MRTGQLTDQQGLRPRDLARRTSMSDTYWRRRIKTGEVPRSALESHEAFTPWWEAQLTAVLPRQPTPCEVLATLATAERERELLHVARYGHWVYLIAVVNNALVKIGHAGRVRTRLSAIRSSNPQQVRLVGLFLGDAELEAELHDRFAQTRVTGEWFHAGHDLVSFIRDEANGW